jgi:hypothetical protein
MRYILKLKYSAFTTRQIECACRYIFQTASLKQGVRTVEIYKSKYLHMAFLAGQQLLEATWLSETKKMSTDECKQEFLNYLDVARQQRPIRMLVDTSDMYFTFGLEMQNWIDQTIFTQFLSMGINKVAFVISKDFFAQLSTKQIMNEKEALKHTREYFDTKEAARQWALSA